MSDDGPAKPDPLPLTLAERVDRACDDFEAAWRAGREPRIEEYLADLPGPERLALLRELITAEVELRRGAGEPLIPRDYDVRFPGDAAAVAGAFSGGDASSARSMTRDSPTRPGPASDALTAPQTPGGPPSASHPTPTSPIIPGYEVLGELGRGGMGVVYRATRISLNRPCALKMILAGELAGARTNARFLAEAEAAAKLRHPNVVQVYQLGEWSGRPFLELEYIEGGSLADRLDGTPWSPREAARMVETLALAIDEAHRRQVVHRDLKPANVLLMADGTPKITDFGLAKALGVDSGLTRTEEVLGTPSYMAPEQAGGHARLVGPAADVYALGAVLYELLTGRPPFKAATVLETLEQVRSDEPVAPSQLHPKLARDLETVCLKCLQKEPSSRYDTAAALADDLRRFLEDRPVRARPVGASQRLWRWCRRNPAVASLTASVAALLVAATIGAGLAAFQFRRLAIRAEQNLGRAREVVDEMYTQVAQQLDDTKGMDDYQRDILQKALRFYEGFAIQQSRQPTVRYEAARANSRVGNIQFKLGRVKEAEAALLRSRELLDGLAAEHQGIAEYREALVASLRALGRLDLSTGRANEAEEVLARSVATARVLAEAHPEAAGYRRTLAASLNEIADVFRKTGRTARAEETMRQVVAIDARLADAPQGASGDADRFALAKARSNLGDFVRGTGHFDEAEGEYRQAATLLERLSADHPEVTTYRTYLALVRNNLGEVHRQAGRPEKAEEMARAALTARETLAADHPGIADYQDDLANSHFCLGNIYSSTGRTREAEAAYRKSLAVREKMAAVNPEMVENQRYVAAAHNNLANLYADVGRLDDAASEYGQAVAVYERLTRRHPDQIDGKVGLGMTLANLGELLHDRGRLEEARGELSRGAEVLEDVLRSVPEHAEARWSFGALLFNRAEVSVAERRYADALPDWERALPLLVGSEHARPGRVRYALTLARLGDHARATDEAAKVAAEVPASASLLYDAACVHALASSAVLKDDRQSGPDRQRSAGRYAAAAVALLARAGEAGFFRDPGVLTRMRQDVNLAPLRPYPGFRLLMMDLAFPEDPLARE